MIHGGHTFETGTIAAGGHATLDVPALDAGTYDVLCTVPGHDQLGMKGTLTVSTTDQGGARGSRRGRSTTCRTRT